MTAVLSPNPRQRFFDSMGNPLSGGKVYTYSANSSILKATYADASGQVPNPNPVILDANGECDLWLPPDTGYKFRLTDINDVTLWTVDNITASASQSVTVSQWPAPGFAPTYVTPTQFSVNGDKRDTFQVNRRIQATCTAGTLYGTVTDAAFAGNVTTVTVKLDSGALDNGLSIVNVGLLTPLNDALPRNVIQYFGVAGGTADALTVTLAPIPATLVDGLEIKVRAASVNTTTTPTLNVNNLGAKTITKQGGQALVAGDIQPNLECSFRYVQASNVWELINPRRFAAATAADQKAGTSTTVVVTPATQQAHLSAAKGWVVFNGTTGAVLNSYGMDATTPLIKEATGQYKGKLASPMSNNNYPVAVSFCETADRSHSYGAYTVKGFAVDTQTFRITAYQTSANAYIDSPYITAIIYGF